MNSVVLGFELERESFNLGLQVLRVILALVLLGKAHLIVCNLRVQLRDMLVQLLDLLAQCQLHRVRVEESKDFLLLLGFLFRYRWPCDKH